MSSTQAIAAILGFASTALAHGTVQGIVAGGLFYQGYSPSMQYTNPPPTVIGWSIPEDLSNGFIEPSNYTEPDIICHLGATPAQGHAVVAAGDVVELQWTPWPASHLGPVLDYLAPCNGPCETVDKTTLEFFKIDNVGLVDGSTNPGTWGASQLIANNNSWTVTIPTDVKPGNYVLRHEIIALHSAGQANGAQNYPQCINLQITGSGTNVPAGTLGTDLYSETDPGLVINIYQDLSSYAMPGPSLAADAVSMAQTTVAITGNGVVATGSGSAAAPTSAAAGSPSSAAASAPTSAAMSSAAASSVVKSSATVAPASSVAMTSPVVSAVASSAPAAGGAETVYVSETLTVTVTVTEGGAGGAAPQTAASSAKATKSACASKRSHARDVAKAEA